MSIGDAGQIDTWINQRGWGSGGITPNWINAGTTHVGVNTAGAGARIKLGRVYGTGRLDYVWMRSSSQAGKIDLNVWENTGGGGKLLRGEAISSQKAYKLG